MTDPRPDPDSEVAAESGYGNDTGFAGAAAGAAGPDAEPAAAEDADDDDPGRGAD